MRTILFILGGFLLLAVHLGFTKLLFGSTTDSMRWATIVFMVLWCVIAGANMWLGVTKANYTVLAELPIFLFIFGLPAAVAAYLMSKAF